MQRILGSLGEAMEASARGGGAAGALLADAARSAFLSDMTVSLAVAAGVALLGALIVLARLPAGATRHPQQRNQTGDDAATPGEPRPHATGVGVPGRVPLGLT